MPYGELVVIVRARWWFAPLCITLSSYFQIVDAEPHESLLDWISRRGLVVVGSEWM